MSDNFTREQYLSIFEEAIERIMQALNDAESKHLSFPDDLIHGAGILTEEVGEAMREAINFEYHGQRPRSILDNYIYELAQAGAMAVRSLAKAIEIREGMEG